RAAGNAQPAGRPQAPPGWRGLWLGPRPRSAGRPLSLGGTWGGTTTPMRLDGQRSAEPCTTILRDIRPIYTLRGYSTNCAGAHSDHADRGGERQQTQRLIVTDRLQSGHGFGGGP